MKILPVSSLKFRKPLTLLLVPGILLTLLFIKSILRSDRTGTGAGRVSSSSPVNPIPDSRPAVAAKAPRENRAVPASDRSEPDARLREALAALRVEGLGPEDARKTLADLRAYLGSLPPSVAAEAIASFLTTRSLDANTGLGFGIGENGFLKDHPSLRVALLDWLGQIDLPTAGIVARQILATPTAADEWCVSLRNYARATPTSDSFDFLRSKTEELIRNPDWKKSPSVGYFEAFDVLVYAKSTRSTDLLGGLVSDRTPGGRAYAHASYLTLDRLVLAEPAEMFRQIASHPELIEARGQMVGNLFARADLRDEEQRGLVRSYLLDPARSEQELEAFSGIYPNASYSVSQNLLTGNKPPAQTSLADHDRAALQVIDGWLADPAFAPIRPHLQTMHRRLVTFVGQAAK